MTRRADTHARVYLALANVDIISATLGKAVEAGADLDDIVVILMDTRDLVARDLAQAILSTSPDLNLDAEEQRVLSRDMIPTGIAVIAVKSAEVLLAGTHPGVAKGIARQPPAGRVRVIAVGEGGATLVHLPVSPVATGSA